MNLIDILTAAVVVLGMGLMTLLAVVPTLLENEPRRADSHDSRRHWVRAA